MRTPFSDGIAFTLRPILLLMAVLAAPATALGQPALLYSEPAQGSVVADPPTAVRLRFNQPMRLDRIRLFDASGAEAAVRRSRDTAPALEQRGGLFPLRPGEYRAEWSASSPAGETISGTLTFRVAEAQPR